MTILRGMIGNGMEIEKKFRKTTIQNIVSCSLCVVIVNDKPVMLRKLMNDYTTDVGILTNFDKDMVEIPIHFTAYVSKRDFKNKVYKVD